MEDKPQFTALQGWRGICAVLVATLHLTGFIKWHFSQSNFIANAYLFVDFFFALSGFVIAHAYSDRIRSIADIGVFAVRRIGRLWPLHAATLAAFVAFELIRLLPGHVLSGSPESAAFADSRTADGLVANLLLVQGLIHWRGAMWNGPSWTISVELWTCLVFATTCLLPQRPRAVLAATLSLGGFLVLLWTGRYMYVFAGFGVFRGLYGFFLGTLAYRAYLSKPQMRLRFPTLAEGLCIAIAVVYLSYADRGPLSTGAPILFAGIVYIFSFEAGAFSRILVSRPMASLGVWSYSIYLVHGILFPHIVGGIVRVQRFFGVHNPGPVPFISANMFVMDALAIALITVLIWVASVTYRLIEEPWRRRFYNFAARLQRRSTGTTAEARPREG